MYIFKRFFNCVILNFNDTAKRLVKKRSGFAQSFFSRFLGNKFIRYLSMIQMCPILALESPRQVVGRMLRSVPRIQ